MPHPNRIKFKGAIYERVTEGDTDDPMFQPLLLEFQNESAKLVKMGKEAVAAMENSDKAVMSADYNMGYAHLKTVQDRFEKAGEIFKAAYEALNNLVGVAGAKAPAKAASVKD